jgi:hypothetical protein
MAESQPMNKGDVYPGLFIPGVEGIMEQTTELASANPELDKIKQLMHERSLQAGRLEVVGPLAPKDKRANWNKDGISLDRRLLSGEITQSQVDHARDILAQSYVVIRPNVGARIGCIDGRTIEGYDDNNVASFGMELGPQIPGGTPIQAVAYRLALGGADGSYFNTDLGHDIKATAGKVDTLGFLAGDHVDDHMDDTRTGCRAIDGVEEHAAMITPTTLHEVEAVLKQLMGSDYNARNFDHLIASATRLLSVKGSYFIDKPQILAKLVAENSEGAPVLTGKHKEVFAVINLVEGETFHRDHFSSQFGGEIQAFNYDAWFTFKAAKALFPYDLELQSRYVHARLALAVTALMDLTDGSPELILRTPTSTQIAA